MNPDLEHSVNSLRVLSVDMISIAKSGHPGICLGAAPIIYSVYANHMKINPSDPNWVNRDRFVMSAGHGSALLYATLFMAGYDISIDDLVNFRRIDSKCPGHPEYGVTPGVEVSTGPLGQGFANAVGMAIAEKYIAGMIEEELPKQKLINYKVYCLASDGDLMEGISTEAAAIASNFCLDNLIVLYDSNDITLDGEINDAKSSNDDIIRRFQSLGWEVDFVPEGNDIKEIDKAIERAKYNKKPTLIEVKTVIGRGSVNEGKNTVHGKPLSKEDMIHIRQKYKIATSSMEITENAVKYMRETIKHRMGTYYKDWQNLYDDAKSKANENLSKIFAFLEDGNLSMAFESNKFKIQNDYNEELRESNSKIMNIISDRTKFFIGGSADLAVSCHTSLYKEISFTKKYNTGRNISFGVREHAMGAILNGISLSGLRTFGSTFLVFSDYLKPAIRMSAMMNLPVTYIFTHDSAFVGQDGPTHEPIEQLTMLRSIPNLIVLRPCDINEVIGCWDYIINHKRPVALVLSKNEAHILAGTIGSQVSKGAYIIKPEKEKIDCILVSTGIDFTTTYLLSEELRAKGIDLRLVSMPSMELFFEQPKEYQDSILPPNAKVFTIEAGSTLGWYKIASKDCAIGIDTFGYSGLKDDVMRKLNFDYDSIIEYIETHL